MKTLKDRLQDERAQDVLGFLVAKGLLRTNQNMRRPRGKINVNDVFWVAKHVEPRALETFPAAYIHFPSMFTGTERIPKKLRAVIEAIEDGAESGPDYKGTPYRSMRRWANLALTDGRTKPISEKRRNKTFRLKPSVIDALSRLATSRGSSQTQVVEELIEAAADGN